VHSFVRKCVYVCKCLCGRVRLYSVYVCVLVYLNLPLQLLPVQPWPQLAYLCGRVILYSVCAYACMFRPTSPAAASTALTTASVFVWSCTFVQCVCVRVRACTCMFKPTSPAAASTALTTASDASSGLHSVSRPTQLAHTRTVRCSCCQHGLKILHPGRSLYSVSGPTLFTPTHIR